MKINRIQLTNFRNHKDLELSFSENASLITGPNGIGKTNILEAIHLMATTKSLRSTYDREMISHDEKFTRIEANVNNGDEKFLEMIITKSEKFENASSKTVKINKVKKTLGTFAGTMNTVLFTPHDIEMFTDSPSVRRRYLDLLFFQIDRDYKRAYSAYGKAVRQRNKILEKIRDFGAGRDELGFWTEKVLENGLILQTKRSEFFEFVSENIGTHANKLNHEETSYKINYEKSELSAEKLEKTKEREIAATRTLIGPRRDDFSINLNGFDLGSFGSRGQKRTTVLALKLCEIDFINSHLERRPVLLLDDIFSELDHKHREAVMNIIELQQTIITSAEDLEFNGQLERISLENQ